MPTKCSRWQRPLSDPLAPTDEGAIAAAVGDAANAREPLAIIGNGTMMGMLRPVQAVRSLSTRNLTGIALYYYPKATIPLIRQYIAEGNNPDQPSRLVQWLYPRTPVYTWRVPGLWFDIGSKETLEEANRIFAKFKS